MRMTDVTLKSKLLANKGTLIAILVTLGLGIGLGYSTLSAGWQDYSLLLRGKTTIGYITDSWEDYEPMDSGGVMWVYGGTYSFYLPDGREFTGELEGDRLLKSEFLALDPSHTTEVIYLPNNLDVSRISDELPDDLFGVFRQSLSEFLIPALLLGIGLYLLVILLRELFPKKSP